MSRQGNHAAGIALAILIVTWNTAGALAGLTPFPGPDPNTALRLDPNEWYRPFEGWQESHAAEVYAREGAEMLPWNRETALPSPDNAAILYYQAFLLCPELDPATAERINAALGGAEPDRSVRIYLGRCRAMIHTAELAAQVPQCIWGIRYLDTRGFGETSLLHQIRQLALALALDARTLATDGHYEAALARCLTMRRLARHVGGQTITAYLISLAMDYLALTAMQHTLGLMAPNTDILQQLRGQLAAVRGGPVALEEAMQADLNFRLERLRNDANLLEWMRRELAKNKGDQQAGAAALTDEDILALARKPYQSFLDRVFQIMDSDMTYEQKCAEIDRLTDRLIEDSGDNPPASYVMALSSVYTHGIVQHYSLQVRSLAGYNALKTAVDVYLVGAETGQLPETLPAHTPKDPFSGQPFEYEITTDGFVLRCRAKDLYANRIWQYEFAMNDSISRSP